MSNPSLVQTGTVGGTPVSTDASFIGGAAVEVVIGSVAYVASHPPGWPTRPQNTGAAITEGSTFTFGAGETVLLLACEAAALVNAGFASYA
jgi:hypothetical protein